MTQVPFNEFAGLDLVSSPDQANCIDLLNVDLDVRGAVRSRDGYDNLTSSAAAARLDNIAAFYKINGTKQMTVSSSAGAFYRVYSTAGATVATQSLGSPAGSFPIYEADFTRFGGPSAEVSYATSSSTNPAIIAAGTGNTVYKWNGSTWSTALGVQLGSLFPLMLEVKAGENRLVGSFSSSNSSRVGFSGAGTPETWGVNDYVDLTPGDGERVSALVSWRELVFVFKETKFFVFDQTSTSSTGTPVFNYRPVATGVGAVGRACAVSTPNGVYFMSRRGIYKTTGGDPVFISRDIDPIFRGGASSFYLGGALNHAAINSCQLTWHDERLYFAYPSGTSTANDRTLVFDPEGNYWTLWDVASNGMASFRVGDAAELVFTYAAGANHIGRMNSTYTNDDGTAITSRYRTGFYDLGSEEEKTLNAVTMWGTGAVDYSLSRNFGPLGSSRSVTLGTFPAVVRGDLRTGAVGTLFSHQLAGTSPWRVHRLAQNLASTRVGRTKTP